VHDSSPEVNPTDKMEIVGGVLSSLKNIVYGFVEDRDGAGDACDAEWLTRKDRKDKGCHEGGE
jgi:hypothetical protein